MEQISKEQEFIQTTPQVYYLFSATILIDSKRKFADIPVFTDENVFPDRNVIYRFVCERFGISDINNEILFNSFAVINIFKFDSQEHYESFLSLNIQNIEEDEE